MKTCSSNDVPKCLPCLLSAFLFLAMVMLLPGLTARLWLPEIGRWFSLTPRVGNAEAIVVLAGGGAERLCHGIELFKRGLAPELWYTGDKPLEAREDFMDSEMARRLAARRGVPAEKIFFLPSTSTFEDGKATAVLVKEKKLKSVLIVTSWYHTRRAAKVLRHWIPDTNTIVFMSSSTNLPFTPENWWRDEEGLVAVVNEMIKSVLYWRRYGIAPF